MTKRGKSYPGRQQRKPKQSKAQAPPQAQPREMAYSKRPKVYCTHWQQPFELNDGLMILASGYLDQPRGTEDQGIIPDVGFYLDAGWQVDALVSPGCTLPMPADRTETVLYPWRDYGHPRNLRRFRQAIEWLFHKLALGAIVETGCAASHGRTGTMLACMLVHQGMEANAAIHRVRTTHCRQAVESEAQINFVKSYDRLVNGREYHPVVTKYVPDPKPTASDVAFAQSKAWDYVQDWDDYEEWWRLNQIGLTDEAITALLQSGVHREPTAQEAADEVCCDAPCVNPHQCGLADGECWKEIINGVEGDDNSDDA